MLTFVDLERPIFDVLHEHDMVTPELTEALAALGIVKVVSLSQIKVCFCSVIVHWLLRCAGSPSQAA
jgi:hypothetical protein